MLTKEIISKKSSWYNNLLKLIEHCGMQIETNNLTLDNIDMWQMVFGKVRSKLEIINKENCVNKARSSTSGRLYCKLDYELDSNNKYLNDHFHFNDIKWILKARGGLLYLNSAPSRELPEDLYHFLSVCPISKEFRQAYLKKSELTMEETLKYLNGDLQWRPIINYCKGAWRYRKELIAEFNF